MTNGKDTMTELFLIMAVVALVLFLITWPRIYNAGKRSGYYTGREDQRADDVRERRRVRR